MVRRTLIVLGAMALALSLSISVSMPRNAEAGVSSTLMALAAPLAEQFGLPGSAVQALFDKGISLESATQLLLVSQSSKKALGDVTKLYDNSSQSVTETANKLNVDPSDYSQDKVQAAIDEAKAKASADAQAKAAAEADKAGKAAGSAIGGFMK